MDKQTQELLGEILQAKSIKDLQEIGDITSPDPLQYLLKLLKEKNITLSNAFNSASMDDSYGRHLKRKDRKLNRNTILKLAFSIKLTLEETQNLLKYSSCSTLYAKNSRDKLIIFAINNKYSLIQANNLLNDLGYDLL